jgi:hypothetical protein
MTDIIRALEAEHERLNTALRAVRKHWGKLGMAHQVMALVEAVAHAEILLPTFETEEDDHGKAFKIRVAGLRALRIIGRNALEHARQLALKEVGNRIAKEEAKTSGLETVIALGTILSCPQCGGRPLQSHRSCEHRGPGVRRWGAAATTQHHHPQP